MSWKDCAPLPVAAAGGYLANVEGGLLYAGGCTWLDGSRLWLNTSFIYDPAKNVWNSGPALPVPSAYGVCATVGGAVHVNGGWNDDGVLKSCNTLEPGANIWREAPSLPHGVLHGSGGAVGGVICVAGGGSDYADLTQLTGAVYTRTDGSWKQAASLPQGKVGSFAAAAVCGTLYLFGGVSAPVVNHTEAVGFEPVRNAYTKLRPLPAATRSITAATINEHTILLVGGYAASGFSKACWLYDTEEDKYREFDPLPFANAGMLVLRNGDHAIAVGGEDRPRARTNRVLSIYCG